MLTGEQIERLEALLARAAFGKLSVSETGFLLEDGHMVGDGVYGDAAPAIAEAINAMPVLLQLARAVQSAPTTRMWESQQDTLETDSIKPPDAYRGLIGQTVALVPVKGGE
jgi:hypothetical protein